MMLQMLKARLSKEHNPVSTLQLAAYIAQYCKKKGIALNVTKLQKIMFCCYGVVLAVNGLRLTSELPEGWQHGPVFPKSLYAMQFFKISEFLNKQMEVDQLEEQVLNAINATIDVFGAYTGKQLASWTCLPGSPWASSTREGVELYRPMKDSDIKRYFKKHVLA